MSDQTTGTNNQQTLVIALVVIAVLLAAIVGVLIYRQSVAVPQPTAQSQVPASSAAAPPAGMANAGAAVPAGPFDPKTATKVPAGMTPEQLVKTYNENVIGGKFAEAYKLLPIDKQQSYGTPAGFEAQVKAYGITSYRMGKPVAAGDSVSVVAEQVTPQMPVTYTWKFTKVGDQWYVESRTMGGTVQ